MNHSNPFEIAIKHLGFRSTFWQGDRKMVIACLVREEDWKPLKADWWKGKEVYLIGADLNGNFFLRHCDGSVRYWDHKLQADLVIAQSVRNFAAGIVE